MFHLVVTASLKKIIESDKVALHIGIRIGDRIANPSLSGKVDNHSWMIFGKYFFYQFFISDTAFNENIAMYFIFRYFLLAVYDYDVLSKVKMAVLDSGEVSCREGLTFQRGIIPITRTIRHHIGEPTTNISKYAS